MYLQNEFYSVIDSGMKKNKMPQNNLAITDHYSKHPISFGCFGKLFSNNKNLYQYDFLQIRINLFDDLQLKF